MRGDDIQDVKPAPRPAYRSVSQLNQYTRCPHSYYLSRIEKVWQRPAAWLAQGSAFHEAAEAWERSGRMMSLEEVQEFFKDAYERIANEACEKTPNLDWWFASGPYGGEEDLERRFLIGLEQCEKLLKWYDEHPEEVIWIAPDGTPGIELGFDIELEGIPIRGFIDAVIEIPGMNGDNDDGSPHPEIIVRDNKTGNSPGDDFQLGVYGVALAETYGIAPPQLGDYYMAGKKGKPGKATHPYNIGAWTKERVAQAFLELEDNIQAGRFDADPEQGKCAFCDVAVSCQFAV